MSSHTERPENEFADSSPIRRSRGRDTVLPKSVAGPTSSVAAGLQSATALHLKCWFMTRYAFHESSQGGSQAPSVF